jgi:hypothetical protein
MGKFISRYRLVIVCVAILLVALIAWNISKKLVSIGNDVSTNISVKTQEELLQESEVDSIDLSEREAIEAPNGDVYYELTGDVYEQAFQYVYDYHNKYLSDINLDGLEYSVTKSDDNDKNYTVVVGDWVFLLYYSNNDFFIIHYGKKTPYTPQEKETYLKLSEGEFIEDGGIYYYVPE